MSDSDEVPMARNRRRKNAKSSERASVETSSESDRGEAEKQGGLRTTEPVDKTPPLRGDVVPEALAYDGPQDEIDAHRRLFWRFLSRSLIFSQKAIIWIVFLGLLWLLRDFFPLIFVTFVFAFVSSSGARFLGRRFPALGWRARVSCVFVFFLLLWISFVWLLVPQIRSGYANMRATIRNFPERWEELEDRLLSDYPWYGELLEYLEPDAVEAEDAPETAGDLPLEPDENAVPSEPAPIPGEGGMPAPERRLADLPVTKRILGEARLWILESTPAFIGGTVTVATAIFSLVFLATLFSYLIVLDLDGLRTEIQKLERTKLSRFYRETGASIVRFGEVLGRVLEAQAVIAFVNSLLTAIGLWLLGVEPVAFLSLIVFVCGFIPVAGVFISSVPICLVGLYQGGIGLCLILVLFIIGIHFVEAYFLNPRIMGAALKVNPVLTLVILVIGHHAFGVWGMLLGLPLCYWFFTHVIRREPREIGLWARYEPSPRRSRRSPAAEKR